MKLAIIPARGGSKRIPRKNIKDFSGKPMIYWPIKAAQKSLLFDHIIVSTDDQDIADIALGCGAEIPFIRPKELSDDYTPTRPVIRHAIEEVEKITQKNVETICCIYATAAFITPEDLQSASHNLNHPDILFSFAAASYPHPPQRAFYQLENGTIEMKEKK